MVKDVCVNGTMANTNKYSSPIPLVGLYIAAAGMVCFLLILCDVWAGFRRKQYWFPCRFFSINSITLTLISIAAKIPVDLTTEMPSKQDQLSKLCGTVFISVSMSFMLPSIAINAEFESYANVIALSIFVITVVVNICIQMATGVIFSFLTEHVIILICMILLLLRFWFSIVNINALKTDNADTGTELIRNGEGNMLARLKLCYIYSYHSCVQLYACSHPFLGDGSIVCIMCSSILVQATLRSVALKQFRFCQGLSDYGWSMWLVVVSQILTVAIITIANGGRMLTNVAHYLKLTSKGTKVHMAYRQIQYLFSLRNIPIFMEKIFKFAIYLPLFYFHAFSAAPTLIVYLLFCVMLLTCEFLCGTTEDGLDNKCEAFRAQLSSHYVTVVEWVLKRAVADVEVWMDLNENVSIEHLICLLSTVSPSREPSFYVGLNGNGIKISSLSLRLLVEIDKAVIQPTTQDDVSLTKVLDEVFEIIHFIETKVNIGSSEDRLRFMAAKVIQKYGRTSGLGEFLLERNLNRLNGKVDFKFIQKPV